jgi:uncharacterized protein with HEPN domain
LYERAGTFFIIFLHDIVENIDRIERFTRDIGYEDFKNDEKTRFATIQCIEIIGEAAKHIPDTIRLQYPAIPWNDIAGMRDKLIHAYFSVDPLKVWKVIQEDIPPLKSQIEKVNKENP